MALLVSCFKTPRSKTPKNHTLSRVDEGGHSYNEHLNDVRIPHVDESILHVNYMLQSAMGESGIANIDDKTIELGADESNTKMDDLQNSSKEI